MRDVVKRRAVIVDLDGTLALMGARYPFAWAEVGGDLPNAPVVELVNELAKLDYSVIITSGRKEQCRAETMRWLELHGVPWHQLFMRADDDDRPDVEMKREVFDRKIDPYYEVAWVFDDRNSVVAMWRDLGLTCLQVAPGDF